MSTGKRPDWNLCVKRKDDPRWAKVGVAWTSEKGNISIRLDDPDAPPDWTCEAVMLFPYKDPEERRWGEKRAARPSERPSTGMSPPFEAPKPPSPPASEPDYMERKRAERQKRAQGASAEPLKADSPDPDPEAPNWL